MFRININGSYADTFGDEEVVLNKSVNNIGDIEFRDGDYTENFDLPLTANNKLIFGNAQVVNSGSDIPFQRLPAFLEVNGNIISVGCVFLKSAGEVYRIEYKGGNADWITLVSDKKLSDLDLDAFNHLWTATNVRDARANNTAWTDVYNYPNVDYGPWQVGPTVYWTDFYPGMYVKFLIWKIFNEIGFTLHGSFWDNNTDLAKEFIPFCANFVRDRKYELRNRFSVVWNSNENPATITGEYDLHTGEATTTNPAAGYGFIPSVPFTFTGSFVVSANRHWLILDSGEITVDYDLTFLGGGGTALGQIFYLVYTDSNGDIASQNLGTMFGSPPSTITNFTGNVTLNVQRGPVYIRSQELQIQSGSNFDLTLIPSEDDDSELTVDETFNYVTLGSTLPDITQKDLIRTFFNQYFLMSQTDSQINYIKLFGFNDVVGNISNALNWSSKVDRSRKAENDFTFNKYAQVNKFLYKEDEQNKYLLASPGFGSGEILLNNQALQKEAISFESEFASVIRQSESFSGTARFAYIPKFIGGDEVDCEPYIGVIEFESTHLITMDGFALEPVQPAMHEIGFKYLIPTYGQVFISIIQRLRAVTELLLANSVDIQQLDHSIPLYLDEHQAYFYINQVKQFKLTGVESTEFELIPIG